MFGQVSDAPIGPAVPAAHSQARVSEDLQSGRCGIGPISRIGHAVNAGRVGLTSGYAPDSSPSDGT